MWQPRVLNKLDPECPVVGPKLSKRAVLSPTGASLDRNGAIRSSGRGYGKISPHNYTR